VLVGVLTPQPDVGRWRDYCHARRRRSQPQGDPAVLLAATLAMLVTFTACCG